jgi:hypothetical protein
MPLSLLRRVLLLPALVCREVQSTPVVGVLTQPEYYVASSYVKWLELKRGLAFEQFYIIPTANHWTDKPHTGRLDYYTTSI